MNILRADILLSESYTSRHKIPILYALEISDFQEDSGISCQN